MLSLTTIRFLERSPPIEFSSTCEESYIVVPQDVIWCLRVLVLKYDTFACINVSGVVETSDAADVLNIVKDIEIVQRSGNVDFVLKNATTIYHYSMVSVIVNSAGCKSIVNTIIRAESECLSRNIYTQYI